MQTVNIHAAKTHLSKLLRKVARGERIVIAKAGKPVAELRPYEEKPAQRVLGEARGQVHVPDDFNDPLPEDILAHFEGR